MKKNLMMSTMIVLLSGIAHADCPVTAEAAVAKKLNLSGAVVITSGGASETDKGVRLSKNSEEHRAFSEMVGPESVIISSVFGLESQGEVTAIIQNKNSCELSVFGTDGEDSAILKIEKVTRTSMTYIKESGQRSEVRKLKKAIAFKN